MPLYPPCPQVAEEMRSIDKEQMDQQADLGPPEMAGPQTQGTGVEFLTSHG